MKYSYLRAITRKSQWGSWILEYVHIEAYHVSFSKIFVYVLSGVDDPQG